MVFLVPPALSVSTDLARYNPGQPVHIHVEGLPVPDASLRLKFLHLDRQIGSTLKVPFTGRFDTTWQPPASGHGFMVVADLGASSVSCGIDVSDRWTQFPRYGYLAHYGPSLAASASETIDGLNRFHIDGIQFYDWQYRHHLPLPPGPSWVDIAKRETSGQTVEAFVAAAHKRNMACMAYNLGFGAVDGYDTDGVSKSWMLYRDSAGKSPYALNMPAGWATTELYLMDPANSSWQSYIYPREKEALQRFGFDGWHMDQLGDLGKVYSSSGSAVTLKDGFPSLLAGAKKGTGGDLVFNNVGGYGIDESLASPTDAMYLECWHWMGQKTFLDIKTTVERMRSTGKSAILAAYMDYEYAKKFEGRAPGRFNLPGLLLADATIFASGGFHLELGDAGKMLDNEYFPNHNLEPDAETLSRLQHYYDFLVAYEDLLSAPDVRPSAVSLKVDQPGVWSFARRVGQRTVIHLLNVAHPDSTEWRDPQADYPAPAPLHDLVVHIPAEFHEAFVATPDDGLGTMKKLAIADGTVTVPRLDYWEMLVLR